VSAELVIVEWNPQVCVCVRERERERDTESVCVCVREREIFRSLSTGTERDGAERGKGAVCAMPACVHEC
jgi:hypothetical protein